MKKLILCALLMVGAINAETINVLAAASLKYVLEDIKTEFLKNPKHKNDKIEISYISAGKAYAQIKNGVKAHFFIAPDTAYPSKVYEDKLGAEEPKGYAKGKLVIFSIDPKLKADNIKDKKSLEKLLKKATKIAIPNPKLAIYGRAAQECLDAYGIDVKDKLVLGESISQSTTYVKTGAAQVGFTSLSLVIKDDTKNLTYSLIDDKLYKPLLQNQIITKYGKDSKLTKEFAEFVLSDKSAEIFKSYGYDSVK